MKPIYRNPNRSQGFTLVELTIAAAVMTIIMAAMVVGIQSEAKNLSEMATTSHRERASHVLWHRIKETLEFAAGFTPAAWLSNNVGGEDFSMQVDASAGFPPSGTLLLEPGSIDEERIAYAGVDAMANRFEGLARGVRCTVGVSHQKGVRALWAGSATALENQTGPMPSQWDGQVTTTEGPLYFRGDGTGFSFRVPTDPLGGSQYFDATGIRWGSKVAGTPTNNGWSALTYVPTRQVTEAEVRTDINGDGDLIDTFSLGSIRLVRWDAFANGGATDDVALCPPIVVQELCNYGGDLDADGFQDPIFLWNPSDGSLRVQLVTFSGIQDTRAAIQRIASTLYLRNGAL